ncbi:MAG: RNB domain-containing ribonuclease [Desulfobacteraceae bacterium]|nr:MAG: RNB domain-containing ribonuclease [Desulfobacteraceae bacterium]
MKIGHIVEYIDQQKIIAAVILQENKGKLRLLTENNREISLSEKRLSHVSQSRLDPSLPRNSLVSELKQSAQTRRELSLRIDINELWEILHEENQTIDVETMTVFCFDGPVSSDHESAVIRAFFNDRLYFRFNNPNLVPLSPEQVEQKKRQLEEARKREMLIQQGSAWLSAQISSERDTNNNTNPQVLDILKDYYLFGNDAAQASVARSILKKAGLNTPDQIFQVMVKAGVWDIHENVDIYRLEIPVAFPDQVVAQTAKLTQNPLDFENDPLREDLTDIPLVTIDGQSTLDLDDAISLEKSDDGYTLGIHIIDVGHYIKNNDPVDRQAMLRGSSIYMPDDKISMIPSELSEDLCSLKEGEIRPAISTMIRMNRFFEIMDYSIIPSIIRVHTQMTYTEANLLNGKDDPITSLYKIAQLLREKRLKAGAIQITLPEVNVWLDENQEINYTKIDRENPSRMLVSEMMIFANSLMARFLADHDMPAVFRSQAAPKQRLLKGIEESLLLNVMQRKHLSRVVIGTDPEMHAGLGVDAYVTATSPIRRYHDLLTQRQIRAILGYESPYSRHELEEILQNLAIPISNTNKVQFMRRRYWILKYLETQRGNSFEALVLDPFRDYYNVLVKEFMLETKLPASGMRLKHGDIVQVTIQHADARRDQLSLFA